MGELYRTFEEDIRELPQYKKIDVHSTVREVVQELINAGLLYPGTAGDFNSSLPWLTITKHGQEAFGSENWLPYDPDGYIGSLRSNVPQIDAITIAYIGEAVASFNRRHLLSATMALGVASENLMLTVIEAYTKWLQEPRRSKFAARIKDRWISAQYREFKKEFATDIGRLPDAFQRDWDTYLDGVFNFIRLNRNSAGHPTGKEMSSKVVYANLQIFSDYASYIVKLREALS
jgi:hypothetical protein